MSLKELSNRYIVSQCEQFPLNVSRPDKRGTKRVLYQFDINLDEFVFKYDVCFMQIYFLHTHTSL